MSNAEQPDLGRIGLWTFALDVQPMAKAQEAAAEIDESLHSKQFLHSRTCNG